MVVAVVNVEVLDGEFRLAAGLVVCPLERVSSTVSPAVVETSWPSVRFAVVSAVSV